jgi:hypothetical protein
MAPASENGAGFLHELNLHLLASSIRPSIESLEYGPICSGTQKQYRSLSIAIFHQIKGMKT